MCVGNPCNTVNIELKSLLLVVSSACLKNGTSDLDNEGGESPEKAFSCRWKSLFLRLSLSHMRARARTHAHTRTYYMCIGYRPFVVSANIWNIGM
jgi:hypothetical protein